MPSAIDSSTHTADTSTPILSVLAGRWSPRSFDPDAVVVDDALTAALEAARWSPSANNSQPWRFIVARRGTTEFDTIAANLLGFNQAWAASASALVVAVVELRNEEGEELAWARYDIGQAVAHLSVQAHHDGLHVHQMGGFDGAGLRAAFDIEQRFEPISVSAVGVLNSPDALPDPLRAREVAPRVRRPLGETLIVNA